MDIETLGKKVIGAAIEVHRTLGPGLLESAYERCLLHELTLQGIQARRQVVQPIHYKGLDLDEGCRIDILVDDRIVLELKVVDRLTGVHTAQLITYLKLSGCTLGYLINFNAKLLKEGMKRIVHQHNKSLRS